MPGGELGAGVGSGDGSVVGLDVGEAPPGIVLLLEAPPPPPPHAARAQQDTSAKRAMDGRIAYSLTPARSAACRSAFSLIATLTKRPLGLRDGKRLAALRRAVHAPGERAVLVQRNRRVVDEERSRQALVFGARPLDGGRRARVPRDVYGRLRVRSRIQVRERLQRRAVDLQFEYVVRIVAVLLRLDHQPVAQRGVASGRDAYALTERVGVRESVAVQPRISDAGVRELPVGVNNARRRAPARLTRLEARVDQQLSGASGRR